jgi:hypothetical protein
MFLHDIDSSFEGAASDMTILQDLNSIQNMKRLHSDTDMIKYYEDNVNSRNLKKLAEVVLAAPASQVSVERAFSGLASILTPQRNRLNAELLNDILVLKLNPDLLEKIDLSDYE